MWNPLNYLGYGSSGGSAKQLAQQSEKSISFSNQSHQLIAQQSVYDSKYKHVKNKNHNKKHLIQQHALLHKRMGEFEQIILSYTKNNHNQFHEQKVIKSFSLIILELEQFMSRLSQIKRQYEVNLQKIQQFDNYKKKCENHDGIVQNLITGHEKQLQAVLDKCKQNQRIQEVKYKLIEGQLIGVRKQLQLKNEEVFKLQQENQRLEQINNRVQRQSLMNKRTCMEIQRELSLLFGAKSYRLGLGEIGNSERQFQQEENQMNLNDIRKLINLENIVVADLSGLKKCINSKNNQLYSHSLTQSIVSYLDTPSMLALAATNKTLYNKLQKLLPKFIYQLQQKLSSIKLQQIKRHSIYYNRILYDELDSQMNKINAIKYLFFNHKPGGYILTMFQEDVTKLNDQHQYEMYRGRNEIIKSIPSSENQQDKHQQIQKKDNDNPPQIKKSWKSFIFKSDKININSVSTTKNAQITNKSNQNKSQLKFSLAQLKNSQTFKKIQQQLSKSFHQHVFSLKLPKDLQSFGKQMNEQFLQLKKELSSLSGSKNGQNLTIHEWTSKLLTLSKFLYLESQQLWGLCQSIFSKLVQFQQRNNKLQSLIQDLTESQFGMRKLVDQLARNKLQMQRRIWQSERKSSLLKLQLQSMQKVNTELQTQVSTIKQKMQEQQNKYSELQKQLMKTKEKLLIVSKKYKQKMDELTMIKEELSKLSWL